MFARPLVCIRRSRCMALAGLLALNTLIGPVAAPVCLAADNKMDRGGTGQQGGTVSAAGKAGQGDKRETRDKGKLLDGVVNLNTAPPALLLLLPGVGPGRVRGILTYRARRPFRTVDELVRVKGIGRRMVREIRPHLAVTGPTTARGGPVGASALEALNALAAQPPPPAQPAGPAPRPPLCHPSPHVGPVRAAAMRGDPPVVRSVANQCRAPS